MPLKSRIKKLLRKEPTEQSGQPRPATPASHVARTAVLPRAESAPETHGIIQPRDVAISDSPSLLAQAPRDLWLEAFEKLPKETHGQLRLDDSTQKPLLQQIQELSSLAKRRQEECEKKFWKLRVGDHEIVLRDYAVTIIDGLRKIGDIAIQFAPPQANIPWSAVKILMQAPVIESAQMCALLASVSKIVRIINRGQVYEIVYTTRDTPDLALENMQATLVDLYSAVLELLANSNKLFAQNTAKRTVYAILHPGETSNLFSKMATLEIELGREIQACESGRSAAADASLTDLLRKLELPLTRVDEKVCGLLERVDASERLRILEWISPTLYTKHHNTVKEARTPGTCQWLLQRQRFREWEDASSSVIMWLQGSPGAGKTFLTSEVIDHVQTLLNTSPNDEGFAFFYCNRNENDRRDPLCVLRSYVRQLSTVAYCLGEIRGNLRGKLRSLYYEMREKGSDITFDTCKEQLLESVNLYPKTTLVLDALDECEPDTRFRLLDTIEYLLQNSARPLKVFISSRPDGDIRDRFLSRPNIEIQSTDNQDDIAKFVNEEIIKHRRWGKISPRLRESIVGTLLNRSQGMFQWAYLQINQMLELRTEAAIKERLGKLPTGLENAYNEIYGKIEARNTHDRNCAIRAFQWVMCACSPLTSVQLLSAIRVDAESDTMQLSDEIDEDTLLELCNNLLVLDSQRRVWRFSHLSVTEYFEKNHWSLLQSHCHVAKVSLLLLIEARPDIADMTEADSSSDRSSDSSVNEDELSYENHSISDPGHPLQRYCQHHWPIHVQTQELSAVDPALACRLKAFLGSPNESSLQYRAWFREVDSDTVTSSRPSSSIFSTIYCKQLSPENFAIFAMCSFKFYYILSDWWSDAEIPLSLENDDGETLLILAALASSKPICEALLRRGMEVNRLFKAGSWGSTLAAAAADGEPEIVRFLVEKGADVNLLLQAGYYGSALAAAVRLGGTEIVKFLVEKGAEVDLLLQAGHYGSALTAAAYNGIIDHVKFLVEKGADVNLLLQAGDYGSALAAAVASGEWEIIQFLIQEGAEVNLPLQAGPYGSALAAAACCGATEIVEFLIEKGADVNMQLRTGSYGSALAAAARWEWVDCVEALIQGGAQVNLRLVNARFSTALEAAEAELSSADNPRDHWYRQEWNQARRKSKVADLLRSHLTGSS